jgi:Co/Zn/Cd efflux system component
LEKHRFGEVHIRASSIFTKTDALANLGTVVGGSLVSLTGTALPDLVLGLIICVIVIRGGIEILRNAKSTAPREVALIENDIFSSPSQRAPELIGLARLVMMRVVAAPR